MNAKDILITGVMIGLVWIFVYISGVIFVQYHENAHLQINKMNGLDAYITYDNFGLSGRTHVSAHECNLNPDGCLRAIEGHSIVEAIGYTIAPIYITFLLLIGGALTFFALGERE